MLKILPLILIMTIAASPVIAAEKLDYAVELKGAVTLYSWKQLADATITTSEEQQCGKQACSMTAIWMTSEGHGLLESLAPTRFLYRSYFQREPARMLAFEERQMKRKKSYQPYGFKHKLVVLSSDAATVKKYELWDQGEPLPASAVNYLEASHAKKTQPKIRRQQQSAVENNALDRWSIIQLARFLPLNDAYQEQFPGTNGDNKLRFSVKVEQSQTLDAAGKKWQAWKLRIVEFNLDDQAQKPPLYLWVSKDAKRYPLRVQMHEDIGEIRFDLKRF